MGWIKSGSATATGATTNQTITGLGSNEFYMAFSHIVSGVGANQAELQFGNNSITTSGYSFTQDKNGVQAAASNSTSVFKIHNTSAQVDRLFVAFICNQPTEEKIMFAHGMQNSSGTAAPDMSENHGKFILTSEINQIKNQSSNLQDGTNFTALGSDGVEALNVQDGAVYYDKTLNKEYVLYNKAWTEL